MKTPLREMTEQWMQLERKTLEQRKLADQFYDNNLMKLIEEDYCERNKDYVFEEVDYLVMSVGTSYEPLVLNIILLKPKKILFLYTRRSEQVLNKIVRYCGLEAHQYQKKPVDEKDPLTIYREIKTSYLEWGAPDKIYIDFTGGTKAMSAAAAMAGALVNIQLIYVGTDHYLTDFRKPDPGTEELIYIDNPITVFGDLEIEKAMVLFNEHNYAGVREKLSHLKDSVPEPDTRQQLEFAYLLAEAYEAWDALDFITASEKMDKLNACLKRDARTHRRFLMMDYRDTLGCQGDLLRCLYHIPEKISDRKQPEILGDKDTMTALMFTMYQNASIREYQEKYDMASLLMYRLLEMIEQRRLMEYGLYASRMDYSKLDIGKIQVKEYANIEKINENLVRIKEAVFRRSASPYLPDQVSLLEGYMLLLAMGDSICQSDTGRPIDFIKKTRGMVYLRNNSIFAHGLGPVGKDNYLKFSRFVTEVFQRYCGLEKIDFYKVKNDIRFLNPMESKYYSSSAG